MPSSLTDVSSFDTVTGPIGGDIRNAASVRAALQTLANRTRFLFDRHAALADIAALKAIASPADGLVRLVKSKGIYVFDSASVAAEVQPFIVAPNAGGGRWIHSLELTRGVANGLAKLNASQHLIVQGASGHPTFETARTLTRFQPPVPMGPFRTGWTAIDPTSLVSGVAGPGTTAAQYFLLTELHDGATLTQVQALFVVDGGHAGVPAVLPSFSTYRDLINVGAEASVEMASGGDVSYPTPGSVAAYEAAGIKGWAQTINNQNVIDRSQGLYYVALTDENGANALAGNRFLGFKLTMTTISDMRPG